MCSQVCRFCVVFQFVSSLRQLPMTWLWRISIPDFIHYIFVLILEKDPVFPFLMLNAKQGTASTIFVMSLIWCGPWLRIEPETSRTRSQHSTSRLSRRQCVHSDSHSFLEAAFFCKEFLDIDLVLLYQFNYNFVLDLYESSVQSLTLVFELLFIRGVLYKRSYNRF